MGRPRKNKKKVVLDKHWEELKEKYKDQILYIVTKSYRNGELNTYFYDRVVLSNTNLPNMYNSIYTNGEVDTRVSIGFDWKNMFDSVEKAEERINQLNNLYHHTFQFTPFIEEDLLVIVKNKLLWLEQEIRNRLSDYPNYDGISFIDVRAGGIQIRGYHKLVKDYVFGKQITINYDMSNIEECVNKFVEMWIGADKEEYIREELEFIKNGEKYGWR